MNKIRCFQIRLRGSEVGDLGWDEVKGQGSHLLMCNRDKPLLGQLPQCGQVSPHVQFTANQHNLGIGAKLLSLSLPLFGKRKQNYGGVEGGTG